MEVLTVRKELKKAIIDWLYENENKWQRVNSCTREFTGYIYNDKGEYLIGGKEVANFVKDAEKLLYE